MLINPVQQKHRPTRNNAHSRPHPPPTFPGPPAPSLSLLKEAPRQHAGLRLQHGPSHTSHHNGVRASAAVCEAACRVFSPSPATLPSPRLPATLPPHAGDSPSLPYQANPPPTVPSAPSLPPRPRQTSSWGAALATCRSTRGRTHWSHCHHILPQ